MPKKRDKIDIVIDMLLSIQNKGGQIKPTHLMYRANLSHKQMRSYLEELVLKKCVNRIKRSSSEYIVITDDGHKFLRRLSEMKEFEKTFGL